MLILVVIAIAINMPADLIQIFRRKQWAVFWFYSVIMIIVVVMTICISMDIKLPSPAITIKKVINAIIGVE